jgi:Matrixin
MRVCRRLFLLIILAGLIALVLPVRHGAEPGRRSSVCPTLKSQKAAEGVPTARDLPFKLTGRSPARQRTEIDGSKELMAGDSASHRYTQLECRGRPTGDLRRRLEQRGVRVIAFLPPVRLVAAVPRGFRAAEVPGLVAEHGVRPEAKLTPRTAERVANAAADEGVLVFAEFYDGVTGDRAVEVVTDAGLDVLPRGGLPEHVLLARGTPAAIGRLAAANNVSQIMQAPEKFAKDDRDIICLSEPQTQLGDGTTIPLYETVSNGWDGAGLGSAALRYYFGQMTNDLDAEVTKAELIRALNTWAQYVDITWTEVFSPNLDDCVEINWLSEGDPGYDAFDGSGGILAHAWYPSPPNPETIAGDIEFDDGDLWEVGNPGAGMDVYSVALHEMGHSLGLGHSDDTDAVMYKWIWPNTVYPGLHADDIAGIQSIYALPPAGTVTTWESLGSHGAAGDIALALTTGSTEPRGSGLHTIRVTFDVTIDPASLSSPPLEIDGVVSGVIDTSGAGVSLDGSGRVMTVVLASPLPGDDRFTIAMASTVFAIGGFALEVGQTVSVGTLVGDVDGSGTVGPGDVAAARQQGGAVSDAASARGDIDGSGIVRGVDLLSIRSLAGQSLP